MEPEIYVGIFSAVISAFAASWAVWSGRLARKDADLARKDALKAAQSEENTSQRARKIAEEANRLQALDWSMQYFEGVRTWADDVTLAITQAMHLSRIQDEKLREDECNRIRSRLSTAIDTGRWFFPNKFETEYGEEKPPAYRGIRRRVLDHVVDAYEAIWTVPGFFDHKTATGDPATKAAYGKLELAKRMFVSEIQETLNPRHREEQVSAVIERFSISERMRFESDAEDEGPE
ncbi:MAG: hypothetical protein AAFQ38_18200 [Pseudomonadota bacterium]